MCSRCAPVFVDQSFKAWIIADRVPDRVELQKRNVDSVWRRERTFNQLQGLLLLPGPAVDLGKRDRHLWTIEGVFRLGQKFDGAFAFADRFLLPAKTGENRAELRVTAWIIRNVAHGFFHDDAGALEVGPRFVFFRSDRFLLPAKTGENRAELRVTAWIIRNVAHGFFHDDAGALEVGPRFVFFPKHKVKD